MAKRLTMQEVNRRIKELRGDELVMDESTYVNTYTKARFIDKDFPNDEWFVAPQYVIGSSGTQQHPKRKQEKIRQTCLKIYGTFHPQQNEDVRRKTEETNLKVYGNKCSFCNEEVREKFKNNMIKNHGVENPNQLDFVKEKKKKTCLENWGVDNYSKTPEYKVKFQQTCLEIYGVPHPMQNSAVALKCATSQDNVYILKHWLSNENIICKGKWEKKFVEYLNKNRIDYNWQVQVFLMPNKKTYRPDCYLPDLDLWIEIKGRKYEAGMIKWEWFHKEYPNSELWDYKVLRDKKIL